MNGRPRPTPPPNASISVFDLVDMRAKLETLKETDKIASAKMTLDDIIINFVNSLKGSNS